MSHRSAIIILIRRKSFEVFSLSTWPTRKIRQHLQSDWNPENLTLLVQQIADRFHPKQVKLLVDESLSYVLTIPFPESNTLSSRKFLFQDLQARIPEEFTLKDFHNKKQKNHKQFWIFLPVLSTLRPWIKTLTDQGIEILSVLPQSYFSDGEKGILEFAADKSPKNNFSSWTAKEKGPTETTTHNQLPKTKNSKATLALLLIILIFSTTLAGYLLWKKGYLPSFSETQNQSETLIQPRTQNTNSEETAQETSKPTLESNKSTENRVPIPDNPNEILSQTSLQILNATTTPGLAAQNRDILLAEGFANIAVGNTTSATQSALAIKTDVQNREFLINTIERALNDTYTFSTIIDLPESSPYTVTITLGEGKNAQPTE